MLVIRLRRGGKKHEPHYRIVVQEQRSKLGGKYLESLGHFHPTMPNKPVEINKERVDFWLKNGTQLSVTVNNLFVKNGILPKEQKISKVYSKKKKEKEVDTDQKIQIEKTRTTDKDKKESTNEADMPRTEQTSDESPKDEIAEINHTQESESVEPIVDQNDSDDGVETSGKEVSDETLKPKETNAPKEEKS